MACGIRAAARLTAPMAAAGAVAKKWLRQQHGTTFTGWMSQLGEISIPFDDAAQIPLNPFYAPNAGIVPQLEAYMDALRRDGDSCGARIEVRASGVPVGLGEPLFDKLDADIAFAMMGINAEEQKKAVALDRVKHRALKLNVGAHDLTGVKKLNALRIAMGFWRPTR